MGVPQPLLDHVADLDLQGVGTIASEQECEGARFHSPTPLVVHAVPLIPAEWGTDLESEFVWLCGTCKANLVLLQHLLYRDSFRSDRCDLPWVIRRCFGNDLRALAYRGWSDYMNAGKENRA